MYGSVYGSVYGVLILDGAPTTQEQLRRFFFLLETDAFHRDDQESVYGCVYGSVCGGWGVEYHREGGAGGGGGSPGIRLCHGGADWLNLENLKS